MKKVLRLLSLLTILCLVFAGCGNNNAENPNAEFKIGIMHLVDHEAVNQVHQGFINALADNGYVDGENITLLYGNGQSDINNLSTIADTFIAEEIDLAFTIATQATQAMAGKTDTIPIVATAVTSFTEAGLIQSDEQPGGNITGTSDMNPVTAQMDLLLTLCPDVKTVGFLYTSSEDNSILQCKIAREYLEAKGIATVERTITNTNDVQQAATALTGECDAIYVPTDNNCVSTMPNISEITMTAGIPLIVGEFNSVKAGGIATVGITYYGLGYQAGLMALDILVNGADPATMPIKGSNEFEYCLNGTLLDKLGIEIPADLQEFAFYAE